MDFFSFSGRSNRMDFWLAILGLALAQFAILAVFSLVVEPMMLTSLAPESQAVVGTAVGLFVLLAPLWPITAVAVRRSHDRNLSGWWYGATVILSLLLEAWSQSPLPRTVALGSDPVNVVNILGVGSRVLGLLIVIVLGFLPGTPGRNRFGPAPGSRHQNYRAPIMDHPDDPTIPNEPVLPR